MSLPPDYVHNNEGPKLPGKMSRNNNLTFDLADQLFRSFTVLNELKVTERQQQLILNANIPLSDRRDDTTRSTNGGSVTKVGAEYRVRATTTSNSRGSLVTQQRGNYISGNIQEPGLGLRIPVRPTGDAFVKWGYYDPLLETGFYLNYTATKFEIVIEDEGSTVDNIPQDDWNQYSISDLDLKNGGVFQFPFLYYGYGPIQLQVGYGRSNYDIQYVNETAHIYTREGNINISEPNLPLTVEVNSGTTGVQLDAFVGGRQISTYGVKEPIERDSMMTYDTPSNYITDTAFKPIITFRHKSDYNQIPLRLGALSAIPASEIIVQIRRNASLQISGVDIADGDYENPGDFTASEIACEFNNTADNDLTDGDVLFEDIVSGGNKAQATRELLPRRELNYNEPYTLCAKARTGTTDGLFTFGALEDW